MSARRKQNLVEKRQQQVDPKWMFEERLDTVKRSMTFMKQLLGVGVSTILQMRRIFPEDCFGKYKLGDVSVGVLHPKDDDSKRMIRMLSGCVNALMKTYFGLNAATLDGERTSATGWTIASNTIVFLVVEEYIFQFEYSSDGIPSMSVSKGSGAEGKNGCFFKTKYRSEENTKKTTRDVMRKLTTLFTAMEPLLCECYATVKLNYYDERTPKDYEPPGFVKAQSCQFRFKKVPDPVDVGVIVTKYHGMRLKMNTLYLRMPVSDDEEEEIMEVLVEGVDRSGENGGEGEGELMEVEGGAMSGENGGEGEGEGIREIVAVERDGNMPRDHP